MWVRGFLSAQGLDKGFGAGGVWRMAGLLVSLAPYVVVFHGEGGDGWAVLVDERFA